MLLAHRMPMKGSIERLVTTASPIELEPPVTIRVPSRLMTGVASKSLTLFEFG